MKFFDTRKFQKQMAPSRKVSILCVLRSIFCDTPLHCSPQFSQMTDEQNRLRAALSLFLFKKLITFGPIPLHYLFFTLA